MFELDANTELHLLSPEHAEQFFYVVDETVNVGSQAKNKQGREQAAQL